MSKPIPYDRLIADSRFKEVNDLRIALDEHAIVAITDPEGKIKYVNDTFCEISKYSREELLGQKPRIVNSGHHTKEFFRGLWETVGRGEVWKGEIKNRAKDGTFYWVDTTIVPFLDEHGKPRQYVAILVEITKRKEAAEKLQLFRALVDESNDSFEVIDPETARYLDVNEKGLALLGYSREEFLALRMFDIAPALEESEWPALLAKIRSQKFHNGESFHRRKNGSTFPVEFNVKLVTLDRDYLVAVVRDITERKDMEGKFFRAQRLEAVGSLASGIAHDMNNILAPILMSASMLRSGIAVENTDQMLATIETSAQRGADLIRQLLTFGSGIEGSRSITQLADVVLEITKIAQQTFPKNISVVGDLPEALWVLMGDKTKIHQVLLNLCVNARDAMPNGGVLTIAAENVWFDESLARMTPGADPGPYLVVRVTDTGTGIPPEVIDRIFDPYFSTKGPGKGTGLGLSTVSGLVKSHGGFISLTSKVGRGTTFHVYLPAIPSEKQTDVAEVATKAQSGHGELILVVEDEKPILEIIRDVLVKHWIPGHNGERRGRGHDAVRNAYEGGPGRNHGPGHAAHGRGDPDPGAQEDESDGCGPRLKRDREQPGAREQEGGIDESRRDVHPQEALQRGADPGHC